jgi:hypothetical protein
MSACYPTPPAYGVINAQSGTTYNVQVSDNGKLLTFNNTAAVALSIPATLLLIFGFNFAVANLGAGTVTITPSSGTIDGAAALALGVNQGVSIYQDGINFWTVRGQTLWTPDQPPTNPTQWDDEFNTSTLNPKWTVSSNSFTSYNINTTIPSMLYGLAPASATDLQLQQAFVPGSTDFQIRVCWHADPRWGHQGVDLALYDATGVNAVRLNFEGNGSSSANYIDYAYETTSSWTWTVSPQTLYSGGKLYMHMQRRSNTYWDFFWSQDGIAWCNLARSFNKSFTVANLAVDFNNNATYAGTYACDWVRVSTTGAYLLV